MSQRDAAGNSIPGSPDTLLHSHDGGSWTGEYFYGNGAALIPVPVGPLAITAGRGFEWTIRTLQVEIRGDTTIVVSLVHLCNLREEGWHSGDVHVHTAHDPVQMPCSPLRLLTVAQAEDLGVVWALDGPLEFTGGPHALSTAETILYYATEWRNQALGHAALLGLTDLSLGLGCCLPPSAAFPTLSGLREEWNPSSSQALVLSHPRTGAGFFHDDGWPGWGLGRELPVLASSGNLDALDIASYSIVGDTCRSEWEGLLSCGLQVPPSAGTDAVLGWYATRPPGGYRVYAREESTHGADRWVEALREGRCFVTNGPLIPVFTVDGAEAGSRLDRSGPGVSVFVQIRVVSALPPTRIVLVRNGEPARVWPVTDPHQTEWNRFAWVEITRSSWLAVRVEGTTTSRFIVSPTLFAQTGSVFVRLNGGDPVSTVQAGRFLEWIDSLEAFVERRGNWPSGAAHADVLARLSASRARYGQAFRVAPSPFALLEPEDGDTLVSSLPLRFSWSPAIDEEPGDEVWYALEISADSLFTHPMGYGPFEECEAEISGTFLPGGHALYWRVWAHDRGGNSTLSEPSWRSFHLASGQEVGPDSGPAGADAWCLRALPNPAVGPVRLRPAEREPDGPWRAADLGPGSLEIFDAAGRLVRSLRNLGATGAAWDRRDDSGRPVPSGVYEARWIVPGGRARPERRRLTARVLVLR